MVINILIAAALAAGTVDNPVIDSAMSREEALRGLDPACPQDIRERQVLVDVRYYSFDRRVHQGQLVIDRALADDIVELFRIAFELRFPFQSVIPLSDERFREDGRWSDDRSMEANNTGAFNYRVVTGGKRLSKHAYGYAIDVNPRQNPYISRGVVLPRGSQYDPHVPGTLTADHPLVKAFLRLGWEWGGNWKTLKDYQHFEKIP